MIAMRPRDLALLVTGMVIWGLNLVTSKIGLAEIPPLFFMSLRYGIVALVLCPLLRIHRGQMSALVVAALMGGALANGLLYVGLDISDNVSAVAIAGQLNVPFTTLLSVALLGEVIRTRRWVGIVLAFTGVLVMGLDPQIVKGGISLVLVIASALAASLGLIAIKKLRDFRPMELQAWICAITVPPLLILSLALEHPTVTQLQSVSFNAWVCVAFAAIGSTLIAHTSVYYLIQRYPVTSVAPLTTLSPIFTMVFSVALLNDQLTQRVILGGLCTLAGVAIITMRERRIIDAVS